MKHQHKVRKKFPLFLIAFLFLTTFLTFKTFKKVNFQDISIYGSELFSTDDIFANSSLEIETPLILILSLIHI